MKLISIFNILFLLPHFVMGQTSKSIELSFDSLKFVYYGSDKSIHIVPTSDDFIFKTEIEHPALPYVGIKVLIDPRYEYYSHRITSFSDVIVKENIGISPNPASYSTGSSILLTSEEGDEFYQYSEQTYPSEDVEYTGTYLMGGYKILCFLVCPFKYNVIEKKLYLKQNLNLNISLKKNNEIIDTYSPSLQMRQRIKDLIVNKDDLELYADKKSNSSKSSSNEPQYEYLIVTCDSLKDEFQRLADWKTMKGVRTKVITTENIYANYPNIRPQIGIKSEINSYYETSGGTLQYVLLGGDHEIVPAELCRIEGRASEKDNNGNYVSVYLREKTPTDLYYASLKDLDWDTNCNEIIGEVSDSIDFSNDIIVTRLSVNSINDARCQINRILNYEQCPDTTGWHDDILMCGMSLGDVIYNYPEGRMTDTHYKAEHLLYQKYIQNNWTNGNRYMFYDTGTSFNGGQYYQFRVDNLQEQFSNGYSFVHAETHGNFDWWKMEWCTDSVPPLQHYLVNNALQVVNPRHTIITTCACKSNGFSELPTCLSEAFMRNPNSGIVAYYGCSESGWFYLDSIAEGPSNHYIGNFYKKLLTQSQHQLGRAVFDSKMELINSCNNYGSFRWLMFGMNILCDPEMSVFLSKPQTFNNVNISLTGNSLNIATGLQDCKICVTSKDDCGDSFYEVAESVNILNLTLPSSGEYNVCITKQGYIPYIAMVGGTVYVQNEDIGSDRNIYASNVFIGKDVTAEKPQGPVTISEGTTKIKHKGDVRITNSFSVNRGAKLEIKKWE